MFTKSISNFPLVGKTFEVKVWTLGLDPMRISLWNVCVCVLDKNRVHLFSRLIVAYIVVVATLFTIHILLSD